MFDTTTFFSIWYWLATALFWSMASHFTHGVPYDALSRAQRLGGEDARIFDVYARRCLERIELGITRFGMPAAAAAGFLLAALVVLSVAARMEIALGLLLILAPAALLLVLSLREARALHRGQPEPDMLLNAFLRRRRVNQTIGMFAVLITVIVFSARHQDRINLYML